MTMARRKRFQSETLQYIYDQTIGDDPKRIASFERALDNARIAEEIYNLRTRAGLTQRELAKRVGTSASTICKLEDADYEGHSLTMLGRIAEALGSRVEVRFVVKKARPPAKSVATAQAARASAPSKGAKAPAPEASSSEGKGSARSTPKKAKRPVKA
jgi:transcriptional regulator with XRE-family HTH domain